MHMSGEVELNHDEYSECQWVELGKIKSFEPKIPSIPAVLEKLMRIKNYFDAEDFVEI